MPTTRTVQQPSYRFTRDFPVGPDEGYPRETYRVTEREWHLRETYRFSYVYELESGDTIRGAIVIPTYQCGWWTNPVFLNQCEDIGIPMKTFDDLVIFINSLYEKSDLSYVNHLIQYAEPYISSDRRGGGEWVCFKVNTTSHLPVDELTLFVARVRRPGHNRTWEFDQHTDSCTHTLLPRGQERVFELEDENREYTWVGWDDGVVACPSTEAENSGDYYYYQRMNYTFKPEPKFMKLPKERTDRYYGVELEVSTDMSEMELQSIVTEVEPKQEPFFYFKDDSSIEGDFSWCYEIVTHPMTARRMKREWRTLFRKLERLSEEKGVALEDVFDLDNTASNGLHIHVSLDAFIKPKPRNSWGQGPSLHLNKFITAFNQWDSRFQEWMKRVSKRCYAGIDSEYYHPNPSLINRTLAYRLRHGLGQSGRSERHSACHTGTGLTAEVRVFAGIFEINHILACLEIVDAMVDFTSIGHTGKVAGRRFIPAFTKFVNQSKQYPYAKEQLACV